LSTLHWAARCGKIERMKNLPKKKGAPLEGNNQSVTWVRGKLFQQKKASQIREIQFHGSRHRG